MHTYAYSSRQDRIISGAGALGMHLLFITLLVIGVNWQKQVEPQANIVDLWANLPSPPQPKAELPPPPPPPVVAPKVEPTPPPKVVAKPDIAKPDIALKQKAELERRILEQKQVEAKKQAEAKKREEETHLAALKEQQAKEAEAQRLAKEKEDLQRKLAEQATAAQNKLVDEFKARIQARIYQAMQSFDDLPKDTFAEVEITVLPDGNVLAAVIKKNSANAKFNAAVERAILRSQPLPVPKDAALFSSHFRRIDLTFRPRS